MTFEERIAALEKRMAALERERPEEFKQLLDENGVVRVGEWQVFNPPVR